ncbi:hypothetical protein GCM10009808_05380 [Microbacterium sediminicola]|uniref:HTH tetR-type domain-containing protein n=1 Tax=Microbacterium sediminicola TaxID=415210 RepID=A0ABN2HPV0_9MICO
MSVGRPRASSREVLAEAACELFLERGFVSTSLSQIASRAGVSRSSFFNYFDSKSDILWAGFDERMRATAAALAAGRGVSQSLTEFADGFTPDGLSLAIVHAAPMGLEEELERERAIRQLRLARLIAPHLDDAVSDPLRSEVFAAAHAAAVFAAVWQWARTGAGTTSLPDLLARSLLTASEGGTTGALA